MATIETIVQILGEGGDITLSGRRTASGWQFTRASRDALLAMIGEDAGEASREESPWVDSWEEGLALLDQYRWAGLYPGTVHPEFAAAVLKAVDQRLDEGNQRNRQRWVTACSGGD